MFHGLCEKATIWFLLPPAPAARPPRTSCTVELVNIYYKYMRHFVKENVRIMKLIFNMTTNI